MRTQAQQGPGQEYVGFMVKIKFDRGDTKDIMKTALKPESLADRK